MGILFSRPATILAVVFLLFRAPLDVAAFSPWSLFDRTSGLVDNTVQVIARDGDGILWIGTRGGLSRFDGGQWRNFTQEDGLPGNDVNTIFFDPRGGIWLGTRQGFGILRDGAWSRLGLPGVAEGERVAVVSDSKGTIWFGYGGGLMRYDGEEKSLSFEAALEGTAVTALLLDGLGRLWAGTPEGLRIFDEGAWEKVTARDGLPPGAVTVLLEDRNGTVWCGTTAGLGEYDGGGWTAMGADDDLPNLHVTSLAEDRQGRIWVGTMGGAGWYDGYDWIWLGAGEGIPSEEVLALGTDRNGSVWVGTSRGLARYDTSWTTFPTQGDDERQLRGPLAVNGEGTVFVAADEGFFEGLGRFSEYVGPRDDVEGRPAAFVVDEEDVLWVGTDHGLYRYDDGNVEHLLSPEYVREIVRNEHGNHQAVKVRYFDRYKGLKGDMVTTLLPVGDEVLWVGTTEGLSAFDGDMWDLVDENPVLAEGEITALGGGPDAIYVGTPDGLWEKSDGQWAPVPALAGRRVGVVHREADGTLWVGTDRGLSTRGEEGWIHLADGEGFVGRNAAAVMRDGAGRLWVGTDAGVALFDGTYWSAYSEADGLHANTITALVEYNGEILLGSDGGVSVFRPDRAPPETRILNPPKGIVGTASRLFEFAASDYETGPLEMRYSWKIDDAPWSAFSAADSVTVEDLANGTHAFSVRSMDKGLNVDPTPALTTFAVDTGLFDIELVEAEIRDLYAALYQVYASGAELPGGPAAVATVRNRYDRPLRVKFSLFIAGLMDFPSDHVAVVEPGTLLEVPLRIEMNERVLAMEKTAKRQALLTLQYSLRGELKESSHALPVTILQRHSMTWEEPERIGLYVTHLDGDIEHFARQVVRLFHQEEKETIIYDNLLRAIEIFDALGAHGLRYVADPENPYGGLTAGRPVLDVVRFPRETLAAKTGDCDDISVLYAALLQNIGIDTALVDVSDHVFVMFDTGLRGGQEGQLTRDRALIHHDERDRLWVPVETTLVGSSFTEAWKTGAKMLRERKYAVIDVREAWRRYSPVPIPAGPEKVTVPTREMMMPLFEQDLALQQENLVSLEAGDLLKRIAEDPGDAGARNALGILLARNGYLRQAEAQFQAVVDLVPDSDGGFGNLGNVLYELERYEEAVKAYRRALELGGGVPEVHVEIALTYCEIGRFDLAREHYEAAMEGGVPLATGKGVSNPEKKQ